MIGSRDRRVVADPNDYRSGDCGSHEAAEWWVYAVDGIAHPNGAVPPERIRGA